MDSTIPPAPTANGAATNGRATKRRAGVRNGTLSSSFRIVRKRVSSLKPSLENRKLYEKIDGAHPDNVALDSSIKMFGLREPLIVTLDNFVVSGHRRLASLKRIDQLQAPCRVIQRRREDFSDDEYTALLRDCNRQRNKSVAEQVREELVDVDPEAAVRNLRELRHEQVDGYLYRDVQPIEIEGVKRRWGIGPDKSEHVKYIMQVHDVDRAAYLPLGNRGFHYPLLNYDFFRNTRSKIKYRNDRQSYKATCDLLTRMRLLDMIPWESLTDETRPVKSFRAFNDVRQFVRLEVSRLFAGYWRNYHQSQPNYLEVVVEKNTVYQMALRVTQPLQIPTTSGRGFASIDPWHELYSRFRRSGKEKLILVVLSDYDPEGEQIPLVAGRTLRDDFGVKEVEVIKAGVTRKQIENYELPPMNYAKKKSSNYDWFVERNGDDAVYELEALDPSDMLDDLKDTITSVLDMNLFNDEIERENDEAQYLEKARVTASKALVGLGE